MKLLNFFRKTEKESRPSRFSDFFLHASEREKENVFREAARRANEDHREVFERSRLHIESK